jgi:hypothetical protein
MPTADRHEFVPGAIAYFLNQDYKNKELIIIHWDDDDWMAPLWIRSQVTHLLNTNADITGLDRPYFYCKAREKAWQYIYPANEKPWVHGGTLCYTKATWQNNPFPEINIAEDS